MVDHERDRLRYARIVHGMTAGTVAVEVLGSHAHTTDLRVTYDLTALTTAGEKWLETFGSSYDAELAAWATDIAAALQPPRRPPRTAT
jgi:hypothetical protein